MSFTKSIVKQKLRDDEKACKKSRVAKKVYKKRVVKHRKVDAKQNKQKKTKKNVLKKLIKSVKSQKKLKWVRL
jgi:dGTP triphosphohydrolase